jgi:hypothetical protein
MAQGFPIDLNVLDSSLSFLGDEAKAKSIPPIRHFPVAALQRKTAPVEPNQLTQ